MVAMFLVVRLAGRYANLRVAVEVDKLAGCMRERNGLSVLHVDKDFELIAQLTGQTVERLRL